ncbi:hypothetical protein LUZ60_013373 [Juncus effusus]|nr:hypothetical protein LUZ60_013373 [Juncus effusus]
MSGSENSLVDVFDDLGDIVEPVVGMIFDSLDDAYNFYLSYSCRVGKHPKDVDQGLSVEWAVDNEHDHGCAPDKVRYMRCHRIIPQFVRKQLEINEDAGIPKNLSIHSMFDQTGGYNTCMYTERDLRNLLAQRRALKLGEGDADALVCYFADRQRRCSYFYYLCEMDGDGRLRNVFWSDGRSRASYKYFGDVVTFDTTYLTNTYEMPFAPFIGVNHHGQSVLFGCALLSDETIPTFERLFQTFLSCMDDAAPKAKLPHKFNSCANKDYIVELVGQLVYDLDTIEEFEHGWTSMVEDEDLGQNEFWIKNLYDIREQWVPIYVKRTFWAGMSTTRRSESMNAYFDKYVNSKTTLREFAVKYETAVLAKWEKEAAEDWRYSNRFPNMVSTKVYTFRVFNIFQEEVKALIPCHSELQQEDGTVSTYVVDEAHNGKIFHVGFCIVGNLYHCTCKLFQFKGIVCRHGMAVYRQRGVAYIPEAYVVPRWRKDFFRTHSLMTVADPFVTRNLNVYEDVYSRAHQLLINLVECCYRNENSVRELLKCLSNIHIELSNQDVDDTIVPAASSSGGRKVLDPCKKRRVGRPRTVRLKPFYEKFKANSASRAPVNNQTFAGQSPHVPCIKEPSSSGMLSSEDILYGTSQSHVDLLARFTRMKVPHMEDED